MITNIFIKENSKDTSMTEVSSISVTKYGIVNHMPSHKYRQMLILPIETLAEFNLSPTELRENLLVKLPFDLHSIESGTILQVGEVKVRLTFHCEPCSKIKDIVNIRKILFKRGYLCQILTSGKIYKGDDILVLSKDYEAIPYKLSDRIKWYLDSINHAIPVTELVKEIGLSKSYCRAIPNIIRNRKDIDRTKILYKNSPKPSHLFSKLNI